jgi:hypothetical protein
MQTTPNHTHVYVQVRLPHGLSRPAIAAPSPRTRARRHEDICPRVLNQNRPHVRPRHGDGATKTDKPGLRFRDLEDLQSPEIPGEWL